MHWLSGLYKQKAFHDEMPLKLLPIFLEGPLAKSQKRYNNDLCAFVSMREKIFTRTATIYRVDPVNPPSRDSTPEHT